ncbi:MAG: hypothetical protein GX748_18550, partial [Lentisphaerae bacterium]|nr:hypothetical protein [Lentisphaerota bacterium]
VLFLEIVLLSGTIMPEQGWARVGVSVIGIEREGVTQVNPTADATLEAGDVVLVLGDDDQIERTRVLLA